MNLLFFVVTSAGAEAFSTTNVQYLYGNSFGEIAGDSISDGRMDTITFEHFGTWAYGSNFYFIDLMSAHFDSGKNSTLYMEYDPAFSLSKISGKELSWGIVKDIRLSAQINQGDDFRALMAGGGIEFDIPGMQLLSLDLYSRKDNFNKQTFQATAVWYTDFRWGAKWIFEGFLDFYGVDGGRVLLTQPRLTVDLSFIDSHLTSLQAGVELYVYGNYGTPRSFTESVPQLMATWVW